MYAILAATVTHQLFQEHSQKNVQSFNFLKKKNRKLARCTTLHDGYFIFYAFLHLTTGRAHLQSNNRCLTDFRHGGMPQLFTPFMPSMQKIYSLPVWNRWVSYLEMNNKVACDTIHTYGFFFSDSLVMSNDPFSVFRGTWKKTGKRLLVSRVKHSYT